MRSAVEFRFYQGIIDALEYEWLPDVYYTLAYGEKEPSFKVSEELLAACEPFLGVVMSDFAKNALQSEVNKVMHGHEMNREILVWTNHDSRPLLIDCAKVVQLPYGYVIRPYMDRTAIMAELLEKMENGNG